MTHRYSLRFLSDFQSRGHRIYPVFFRTLSCSDEDWGGISTSRKPSDFRYKRNQRVWAFVLQRHCLLRFKSTKYRTKDLLCKGFVGKYPSFSRAEAGKNLSLLVTEEHPFTLSALEYENYEFRLQIMVSETSGEGKYLNQGFFTGTGNHGWIAKTLDDI